MQYILKTPNIRTHLCKVPLMIIRPPYPQPVPRSQPQLKEPSGQHVNLLLQLGKVPPDVLLADHQALPVPKGVGCNVHALSNGDPNEWRCARPANIAPVTVMVHLGLFGFDWGDA